MSAQIARVNRPQQPILLREPVGSICVLTLNRPAARNSLSEGLIAELTAALGEIHDDTNVRAVVIAANGPAFSAGHDMKELTARRADADRGRAYFAEVMTACSTMMQAIVHLPKPVVAAVQGVATAAGCQMVASCDLGGHRKFPLGLGGRLNVADGRCGGASRFRRRRRGTSAL